MFTSSDLINVYCKKSSHDHPFYVDTNGAVERLVCNNKYGESPVGTNSASSNSEL